MLLFGRVKLKNVINFPDRKKKLLYFRFLSPQQQQLLQQQQQSQQQHPQGPQSYLSMMPASRGSEPNLNQKSANPNNSSNSKKESVMQQQHVVDTAPPEKEKIEVIPLNLEKPTGLEMGDFLPMKFQMMGLGKILTPHELISRNYQKNNSYCNFDI